MRKPILTRPLVVVTLFFALLAMTSGCRRRAAEVSEYNDPHPLPEEPWVMEAPSIGRHGGRFVIAEISNPRTFNALMANESSSSNIVERMFLGLAQYDNVAQKFIPALAKSWELAPDGLTWTFHLRKGARFSDAHPITAEDVLFSFQVVFDKQLHPVMMMQNLWRSNGLTHMWFIGQLKPDTPQEARIDQLMDVIRATHDLETRKKAYKEVETIHNEMAWEIWLPSRIQKIPVSNRFGNLQPSILRHRILWSSYNIYVK